MTTETKRIDRRDLHADLAICAAASAGPWDYEDGDARRGDRRPAVLTCFNYEDGEWYINADFADKADAVFAAKARTGWPHALERAITAEERVRELCESDDRRWELEETVSRIGNDLADAEETITYLRAGIAAAMTYPPGIIRAKLSRILAEVGADE